MGTFTRPAEMAPKASFSSTDFVVLRGQCQGLHSDGSHCTHSARLYSIRDTPGGCAVSRMCKHHADQLRDGVYKLDIGGESHATCDKSVTRTRGRDDPDRATYTQELSCTFRPFMAIISRDDLTLRCLNHVRQPWRQAVAARGGDDGLVK
jgi:hypothetical protein